MPLELATWLVRTAYLYVVIGVILLPWWHFLGLRKMDTEADSGPWGFRILISPGLIALWPWLLPRAWRSRGHPDPEKNAHRENSQKPQP